MSNTDKMYEIVTELEKYAELEGTEWSETVYAMTHLWQIRTLLDDKMVVCLEKEIQSWLKNVKKNATIVEETIEPKPYTVKTLEWTN